jgi:hypothetical protein
MLLVFYLKNICVSSLFCCDCTVHTDKADAVFAQSEMKICLLCSETLLTGESRFHICTPWGWIEPESLMTGSKWVDQWTSGTVYECSEIAGSPQGSPPAADYVGCEAGRRTCRERETGTEELCEIKWDYHIVGTMA